MTQAKYYDCNLVKISPRLGLIAVLQLLESTQLSILILSGPSWLVIMSCHCYPFVKLRYVFHFLLFHFFGAIKTKIILFFINYYYFTTTNNLLAIKHSLNTAKLTRVPWLRVQSLRPDGWNEKVFSLSSVWQNYIKKNIFYMRGENMLCYFHKLPPEPLTRTCSIQKLTFQILGHFSSKIAEASILSQSPNSLALVSTLSPQTSTTLNSLPIISRPLSVEAIYLLPEWTPS